MLKYRFTTLLIFISRLLIAQSNTEIFVMDLDFSEENFQVSNFENISQKVLPFEKLCLYLHKKLKQTFFDILE